MSIEPPLYDVKDTLYLKESAALGHLEAVTISGVTRGLNGWTYTIYVNSMQRPMNHLGSGVNGAILQFSEAEFVDLGEALLLAEANAQRQLDSIRQRRISILGENPTLDG